MKKKNLFVINSIIIIASSLLIRVICAGFDIFLANKIGAEALGVYNLVISIYMFCITLSTSGINLATTKVISEEIEKNKPQNIPSIIKRAFIYSLIFGIISALILLVNAGYICKNILMNKVYKPAIYTLALSLPFISLSAAINGYFLASRKVKITSFVQVSSQLIRILIIALLVTFIFPNNIYYAVFSLIIGTTISEIISFLLLYFNYLKEAKIAKTHEDSTLTKRLIKIALPIAITSYIRSFLNTVKQVLIPLRLKLSGMSYEKAISNYGIITGMAMPIIMFPSVIVYSYSSLLIPEFSRLSVEFNIDKMNKNICKLFKITLYFSICVTGILMYYGKELGILLYGLEDVAWYIKIISPLIILMYLDNVIDSILRGIGKQISVMLCNILDLIISLSFIYFLLPIFSINGYIIVLYISEILNYTISVITLFKTTNLKFKYFEWFLVPVFLIIISLITTNMLYISTTNAILDISLKIIVTILIYMLSIKLVSSIIYKKKK